MSSNKTPNLNLHSWADSDKVLRSEFVENFTKVDSRFNASNGHSHDGKTGSGSKIAATSVDYTSEKNVKEALDELFQSANRYIKSIADTIGEEFQEDGNVNFNNMAYFLDLTYEERLKIIRAITNKHGNVSHQASIKELEQAILNIPYNLEPQGTADAIDVAQGETFLNRTASLITGTRPLINNKEYLAAANNTPISNAIYENSIIKGEPNLIPESIKKGTTIFGVTGTYTPVPGYNIGDTVEYGKLSYLYNASSEGVTLSNVIAICPQGYVWTAKKQSSSYLIENSNTGSGFYFSPYTDIKTMTIDFNGFYFLTSDMIYCTDYVSLKNKWGVTLSSFISPGDTVAGVCTNHLGEVIVVTQKGRIYVLRYTDGSLSDMYKIAEEFNKPINISKVRQRFSCDDIILLDKDNNVSFYIDSDINGNNNTRVLFEGKGVEVVDIITTDTQNSYILRRQYSAGSPIKRAYISSYNYGTASSNTVDSAIGEVVMDSAPERLYLIENLTFLIVSPTEAIVMMLLLIWF